MSRETASSSAAHIGPGCLGPTWQEVVGRAGWVSRPGAGLGAGLGTQWVSSASGPDRALIAMGAEQLVWT